MYKKYTHKLFIVSMACIFLFTIFYTSLVSTYSLVDALNYYGFTTTEQKNAFIFLLQKSSIIDQRLEEIFPKRETEIELVNDIAFMIKQTQEQFVKRDFKSKNPQERWEIATSEWTELNQTDIIENLKQLGVIDAVKPKTINTDAICIFGATGPTMEERIEYAYTLIQSGVKTKAIILLAGQRYVTENIDGTEEELINIADFFGLSEWKELTETHLIEYHYKKSILNTCDIPYFVIDTPRGDKPRPTTETTLLKLIEFLQAHPEIKHIIFVSNQPHVHYQKAIVELLFNEYSVGFEYEVVGAEASHKDIVKKGLGGLGTFLWAATPIVLLKMGIRKLNQSITELYSHNSSMNAFLTTHFIC